MVMTQTHAKGQRSVGSKNRVETNGQTDAADCITFLSNVVGNDDDGSDNVVRIVISCKPYLPNSQLCFILRHRLVHLRHPVP